MNDQGLIDILNLVNPPEKVISWQHLQELIHSPDSFTVIERQFFIEAEEIVKKIKKNDVKGDVVVAGVFKGGSTLYLKALFEKHGLYKKWWLFDSFKGFNTPTLKHEQDINSLNNISNDLILDKQPSVQSVYAFFRKNGLHHNLEIIEGYFEETFEKINISEICLVHVDVDFYEPTLLCLEKFYQTLQPGGWMVIDDYFVDVFKCREAVDVFREKEAIIEPIRKIGNLPAGWEKADNGKSR